MNPAPAASSQHASVDWNLPSTNEMIWSVTLQPLPEIPGEAPFPFFLTSNKGCIELLPQEASGRLAGFLFHKQHERLRDFSIYSMCRNKLGPFSRAT